MPTIKSGIAAAIWDDPYLNNGSILNDRKYIEMLSMKRPPVAPPQPPWSTVASAIENEPYRFKLLAMRLRMLEGEKFPFEHLFTGHTGDKVFVVIIDKGECLTFEDSAALFPSDTLITQIRMIQK